MGVHSLDPELVAMAALHPTYVVTRNSHAEDISTFLERHGVHSPVHVVRKKTSKAKTMLEILPGLTGGGREHSTAILVDDDVRECCDAATARLPGLFRVLFSRCSL